jgi:radical SAM protein with 4Fe4S-binding SPASM domain
MSGKYAKLKRDWSLRGWSDVPMVLSNCITGEVRQLNQKGFYVAESCDGNSDFDSLAYLPEHHAVLDELIKEGIAEACQDGDSIEPIQKYRKAENPCLRGIHWCVTGLCNLNCRHCYMESPSKRYGELPFEDMVRLVEQFERANVLQVSLTGGEPFLRKDILDIVALLAEKRIHLNQIYSNGLLITDNHLHIIKKLGFSPGFQISFDGVGAHDHMRGVKGIEARVIMAIRRVRAAGFPVVVATSIDRTNIDRLHETYTLMKDLAVHSWRISSPQKTGNWRGATTNVSMDKEMSMFLPLLERWSLDGKPFYIQLGGFFRGGPTPIEEAPIHNPPKLKGTVPIRSAAASTRYRSQPGSLESKPSMNGQETPNYTPENYDCASCRERLNLLPDGTLFPCPAYVDSTMQERMPNLLREDLSKVWAKSFLREIADMKKKDLFAKNPECAVCELFAKCGLGCRASALTETGDLMAKDPISCELWKNGYKKRFEELAIAATNSRKGDGGVESA